MIYDPTYCQTLSINTSLCLMPVVLLDVLLFFLNDVHVFHKPHCFLSQRSNLSLLPLPPYAFVFSFVLLKRINILEGILSSAFLSFRHLPRRETLIASALLLLEEEQLSVLWRKSGSAHFSVKSNHVAHIETCSQSSQRFFIFFYFIINFLSLNINAVTIY